MDVKLCKSILFAICQNTDHGMYDEKIAESINVPVGRVRSQIPYLMSVIHEIGIERYDDLSCTLFIDESIKSTYRDLELRFPAEKPNDQHNIAQKKYPTVLKLIRLCKNLSKNSIFQQVISALIVAVIVAMMSAALSSLRGCM